MAPTWGFLSVLLMAALRVRTVRFSRLRELGFAGTLPLKRPCGVLVLAGGFVLHRRGSGGTDGAFSVLAGLLGSNVGSWHATTAHLNQIEAILGTNAGSWRNTTVHLGQAFPSRGRNVGSWHVMTLHLNQIETIQPKPTIAAQTSCKRKAARSNGPLSGIELEERESYSLRLRAAKRARTIAVMPATAKRVTKPQSRSSPVLGEVFCGGLDGLGGVGFTSGFGSAFGWATTL